MGHKLGRGYRIHVSRRGDTSETVAREVGGRLRGRRKEVALGRLRTLTILLTLGAWGAATEGAPPDATAPPASTATRPPAPVAPVKYLEAGARLFNSGQYALAAKYLNAAQTYRDQLKTSEQTVLDAYLKEMSRASAGATDPTVQPTAAATPTAAAAPAAEAVPASTEAAPVQAPASAPAEGAVTNLNSPYAAPAASDPSQAAPPASPEAAPAPAPSPETTQAPP